MKRETTPSKVTEKVMQLCNQVVPGLEPDYIPVMVQKWCLPSDCFLNVEKMVREQGGKQVNGWVVWQWVNILIETEAHAIWENSDGKLIDITPHDNNEKNILFLRDDALIYSGKKIKGIKMALTNSALASEIIQIAQEIENIKCEYKPGTEVTIKELQWRLAPFASRQMEIMNIINQDVKGNEFCPCQSGMKYKKCCGREE